jgi:hypothetical protein
MASDHHRVRKCPDRGVPELFVRIINAVVDDRDGDSQPFRTERVHCGHIHQILAFDPQELFPALGVDGLYVRMACQLLQTSQSDFAGKSVAHEVALGDFQVACGHRVGNGLDVFVGSSHVALHVRVIGEVENPLRRDRLVRED